MSNDATIARDDAIGRSGRHANHEWLAMAEDIVRSIAKTHDVWTTDDVWRVIAEYCAILVEAGIAVPHTHDRRALGAVNARLARQQVIRTTGQWVPSTRKSNHARPIPVWTAA